MVQLLLCSTAKHLHILSCAERRPFGDWDRFGGAECRRYDGVREIPRELDSIADGGPRTSGFFIEPRGSYTNSHSTQPSSFTLAPTPAESKRGANGTGAVVLVVRNTYSRRNRRILALEPVPEPVGVAGDDLERGQLPGKLKVAFREKSNIDQ